MVTTAGGKVNPEGQKFVVKNIQQLFGLLRWSHHPAIIKFTLKLSRTKQREDTYFH